MNVSMRLVRLLFTFAALACVFSAGADAADRGPCIPGQAMPVCYHWEWKFDYVGDGDTILVHPPGEPDNRKKVRFTAINAMEQSVYSRNPDNRRGECHALEATARLDELIGGANGKIRLSAQDPASHSG